MTGPRRLAIVTVTMLLSNLVAAPAMADAAGPTHYRSTVTAVEAADGEPVPIEVEVLGGDAFLAVSAEPGSRVEVPGYQGEPYVRIDGDGNVAVNDRSPARWINNDRYAAVEIPPIADLDAPPSWAPVADGGEYGWHDHRIHFMSPSLPDTVDESAGAVQPVQGWSVPLTVDGREVTISGELVWIPSPSPLLPIVLFGGALAMVSALVVLRRRALAPVVLGAAATAAAVGLAGNLRLPAGTDSQPALVVLPLIAAMLAVAGMIWQRRGSSARDWLTAAAGLPVLVWGVLQFGALTRPVVPGPIAAGWVRLAVVLALAVGSVAVVVLVRRLAVVTRRDVSADEPGR